MLQSNSRVGRQSDRDGPPPRSLSFPRLMADSTVGGAIGELMRIKDFRAAGRRFAIS
jgi:hypothetical protein